MLEKLATGGVYASSTVNHSELHRAGVRGALCSNSSRCGKYYRTGIPLPVAVAQEQLKEAEKLTEKVSRSQDENKRLDTLLTDTHTKLEFAQALGYGTKSDFKDLYAQLDEIKDKTSAGKSGTGFFAKIKSSLASLVKSSQPQATNPPAGGNDKSPSNNNAK